VGGGPGGTLFGKYSFGSWLQYVAVGGALRMVSRGAWVGIVRKPFCLAVGSDDFGSVHRNGKDRNLESRRGIVNVLSTSSQADPLKTRRGSGTHSFGPATKNAIRVRHASPTWMGTQGGAAILTTVWESLREGW